MYIGIDIGGTHTRVATGEEDKVYEKIDFPTKEFDETVNLICEAVIKLSKEEVNQLGVSIAGPYNFRKQIFLRPPNLPNPESWENKNLKGILSKRLKVQTTVAHDASVAALGEAKHGAGKGKDPVLYYTVSTGIGSGLIVNSQIFHGITNPEAGHQIINKEGPRHPGAPAGDLESISSGSALKRLYGKNPADVEGTPEWLSTMDWLAIGLTNSILHFSPEIIVIGGGMTKHKDIFFTPLKESINKYLKHLPQVPIVPAGLGQDSGLIGAIELARQADQNG